MQKCSILYLFKYKYLSSYFSPLHLGCLYSNITDTHLCSVSVSPLCDTGHSTKRSQQSSSWLPPSVRHWLVATNRSGSLTHPVPLFTQWYQLLTFRTCPGLRRAKNITFLLPGLPLCAGIDIWPQTRFRPVIGWEEWRGYAWVGAVL